MKMSMEEKRILRIFGAWLEMKMEKKGLRLGDLAKAAEINSSVVRGIMDGKHSYNIVGVMRVCTVLEADIGLLTDPERIMIAEKHLRARLEQANQERIARLKQELKQAEAESEMGATF
jgi:predicted transcriptional regulator